MDAPSAQSAGSLADGWHLSGMLGAFGPFEGAMLLLILALVAVCVVWGLRLPPEYRGRGRVHRAAATLMPLALLLVALLYLRRIGLTPHEFWNGALLTPSVALGRGYHLYYGRDAGPIQVTEYGPVSAIVYLPAALAATPTSAILIAGAIAILLALSPLILLLARGRWKEPRHRMVILAGIVFAASALTLVHATRDMATTVSPNAPAVGLGLLSCLVIMRTDKTPGHRRLALAALLATLSCWAKQIEAPLILAQAVYLGLAFRWRTAVRFLVWVLVMGTAAGLGFAAVFRFQNSVWHMFTKHTHRPWDRALFDEEVLALLRQSAVFILLVTVASAAAWRSARRTGRGFRSCLRENRWALLVLAAVFLLPTGALADAIKGGGNDSYHSAYYLIAASSLILVHFATKGASSRARKNVAHLLFVVAAWALICQRAAFFLSPDLFDWTSSPQHQAYRFALEHPEEAYFPWHPLATLMAEGRLYHCAAGVIDRIEAGHRPTDSHFQAYLPPNLRYVIFQRGGPSEEVLDFLPEFRRRIRLGALSGWVAYVRDEGKGPRAGSGPASAPTAPASSAGPPAPPGPVRDFPHRGEGQ